MDVVLVQLKHGSDFISAIAALAVAGYGPITNMAYHESIKNIADYNPHKYDWMVKAGIIVAAPVAAHVIKKHSSRSNKKLGVAVAKTARAGAAAVYLASLDGPLPFADVLAATYFGVTAARSWHEYFID